MMEIDGVIALILIAALLIAVFVVSWLNKDMPHKNDNPITPRIYAAGVGGLALGGWLIFG